ncbi:unnamed protein product [Ectocarpus sp. CCAP 1310/34]|nr:unnamed protein product [Ectocarpus sp. CCAP 1310/34]
MFPRAVRASTILSRRVLCSTTMMQRTLATSAFAIAPGRILRSRAAVGAAMHQKRPLPRRQSTHTSPKQVLLGPTAATASDQLPTAIRCPATGGRLQQHRWQQQRQQRSSFSSQASEQEAHSSSSSSSSSSAVLEGSLPSSSAPPSTSCHTVVKHPPASGWEFPPVPAGCEPTFAVIRLGNTQHKVTKDDVIVAEKLVGDIGTTLETADVLLVGTRESTVVGRPTVPGAMVKLFVEEQTRDKKVIVFKKRRRKSSKTTQGHRREVTLLRVVEISS